MLDERDLLAIGQLMEQKLTQQKQEILEVVSQQKQEILEVVSQQKQELLEVISQQKEELLGEMGRQKQELLGEMGRQKEEILTESTHRMKVLIESEFQQQFNLLAEDLAVIREKMVPESRMEEAEDDIIVLKSAVRQINQEIREMKRAQ